MGSCQDDVYMLQYEKTGNEDPIFANKSGFTRSRLILIFQVYSHLKNVHVIDKTRGRGTVISTSCQIYFSIGASRH